jgi:VWFA-related protein
MDVLVVDASGRPVHGLQQKDFAVTDNGHPRDIQIFGGEIDADETAPRVFSNRLGLKDSRIVTAIVIDGVRRPENINMFALPLGQAKQAISGLQPGQTMAIYAMCPDLRVVQDYTSDVGLLLASLNAFVIPRASSAPSAAPMLSALRDLAGRMSGSPGRKSIVWISQGYGEELSSAAIRSATDTTVAALNDVNVSLYAVDARFNPTCREPLQDMNPGLSRVVTDSPFCFQTRDPSDDWMEDLAQATGGRAFTNADINAVRTQVRDAQGHMVSSQTRYQFSRGGSAVDEALRFAVDDSRYAYELGFYVPEPELDGKLHTLAATLPGKPKYALRYRSGYLASANVTAPPAAPEQAGLEVGIDATVDIAAAQHELHVSLALDPATLTRRANGAITIDETFIETDDSGRQLAKVQETVPVPAPGLQDEMLRYTRSIKLIRGAVQLHITIRDPATKKSGSLAIPITKQ